MKSDRAIEAENIEENGSAAIRITIRGAAYRNLARIAGAINATPGMDSDNTPLDIIQLGALSMLEDIAAGGRYAHEAAYTLAQSIDAPEAALAAAGDALAAVDFETA